MLGQIDINNIMEEKRDEFNMMLNILFDIQHENFEIFAKHFIYWAENLIQYFKAQNETQPQTNIQASSTHKRLRNSIRSNLEV